MKTGVINTRVEQEVKDKLGELADESGQSQSDFITELINDYEAHQRAVNEVNHLKIEVNRLEAQAATLNVPRLQVLYEELRGKQVGKRVIESKADLLAVLSEEFRYQEQEGTVTVTTEQIPVTAVKYEMPTVGPFSLQKAAFMIASLIALVLAMATAWRWGKKDKA